MKPCVATSWPLLYLPARITCNISKTVHIGLWYIDGNQRGPAGRPVTASGGRWGLVHLPGQVQALDTPAGLWTWDGIDTNCDWRYLFGVGIVVFGIKWLKVKKHWWALMESGYRSYWTTLQMDLWKTFRKTFLVELHLWWIFIPVSFLEMGHIRH